MKIIRANQINKEYQYSSYKIGDVFEVIGNYYNHYIAKILSSSEPGGVVAVKKIDCEEVHLGSYTDNNPITMIT